MNTQGKKSRPMTFRAGRVVAITIGLLLTVVAVFADQPQSAGTWTVRDHIPLDQFIIQAHRGAGELAEENSIPAFELGWKLNCIPESDLRTTKDGVIVAFHDNNFARVVKDVSPELAKKGVKDLPFAELMKLDVGSFRGEQFTGRRVARMSEVFALMRGKPERRLYMDIKNVDLKQLAGEVKEAGVERQVILASTKYDVIRNWKKLAPDSQTLLWMGGTEEYLTGRFEELRKANFADVTQVQVHTHLPDGVTTIARDAKNPFKEPDAFLRARGEELRQHNILYQTLPYGGSTREVYLKLLDLGFMSFATDHPDVTWAAVREFYGAK
jgi:glycerophosphoryl diester phosphodiesterase